MDELNEGTGFCFNCTPSLHTFIVVSRVERWLTKYADDIEAVMLNQTLTARQAIVVLASTYRAKCVICGCVIKHGTYGRHFICNTTSECKKARRRYKYLIYDKGYSKDDALKAILPGEIDGYSSKQTHSD